MKTCFKLTMIILFLSYITSFARTIEFADVTWQVKSGGPKGPGPNHWSDSVDDVWVDDQGQLHLNIVQKDGVWYCSEVYTDEFMAFGEYRFLVDGFIDRMDMNIVLGLFVYAADDAEVDIEYSKWNSASNTKVGGFTIQPYYKAGHSLKFVSPLDTSLSTHLFNWQADKVYFASYQSHHTSDPSSGDLIKEWTYTGADIPDVSRNLRAHINFWLFGGRIPADMSVMEVVIKDVRMPLNTAIKTKEQNSVAPQSMHLQQNYPNPFNGDTIIRYRVLENTRVNLKIIDSAGRVVTTLVDQEQSPDEYRISFSGTGLPSGLYFCQLSTDQSNEMRKMLLIQ